METRKTLKKSVISFVCVLMVACMLFLVACNDKGDDNLPSINITTSVEDGSIVTKGNKIQFLVAVSDNSPYEVSVDNEELAKKIGYSKNHVLKSNRFKIYITQSINKTSLYELKEIPVDSTNGIESTSFDSSIEEMNLIQQAVQLGEFPADDDFTIVEGTQAGERE